MNTSKQQHQCTPRCRAWGACDKDEGALMHTVGEERRANAGAELIAAGEAVVASWERGDLAAAVRRLDAALQSIRLATEG